ncbi:MAG: SurA N-terminal domain-containing protein [Bacteroidota bacterium]
MGFFTYIQKNKWITNLLLFTIIASFVMSSSGGLIDYFINPPSDRPDLAIIAGQKVQEHEYQTVFALTKMELAQTKRIEKRNIPYLAHRYSWKYFVQKNIYKTTCNLLGIEVPYQEQIDMLEQAKDMYFFVFLDYFDVKQLPVFKDAKGNFDKKKWQEFIFEHIKTRDGKSYFSLRESKAIQNRLKAKLDYIVQSTVHTTKLEATQSPSSAKVNIRYIYIPYTSSLSKEAISTKEKTDYLHAHSKLYQVKGAKVIDYITMPIIPSAEDKNAFEQDLHALCKDFQKTAHPYQFAKRYTDSPKHVIISWKLSDMPDIVKSQISALKKNKVVGPANYGGKYKMYRLISHKGKVYKLAQIQKQCMPSEYTIYEHFRKAESFKATKSVKAFQQKAKQLGFPIHSLTLKKEFLAATLGETGAFRSIQRWAFHPNTRPNSVSDPFEENNTLKVCIIKEQLPAGTAQIEDIGYHIEATLRNQKAGAEIIARLKPLVKVHKTLKKIAKAYGKHAKVYTLKNVSFQSQKLPHVGHCPKAIGSAFGLKKGQKTGIIADKTGVFIVEILSTPDEFTHIGIASKQQKIMQAQAQKSVRYDLDQLWLEKSNISDNRHVFF